MNGITRKISACLATATLYMSAFPVYAHHEFSLHNIIPSGIVIGVLTLLLAGFYRNVVRTKTSEHRQ